MSDERNNLPSASGLERLVLCPGSWNLEKDLPEPEQSEDAESGNRIHALLASQGGGCAAIGMIESEITTALLCADLAAELKLQHIGEEKPDFILRESRLWLHDAKGNPCFSGKPDLVYISGKKALCIDYKTSHGDVTSAEGNWQLRALAVLVASEFGIEEVIVAIVQPHVSPQTSVCRYTKHDLEVARAQIRQVLIASHDAKTLRIPGPKQCQFCKAKAVCPEAQGTVTDMVLRPKLDVSSTQLGTLLDRCILAADVIDAIRTEAKKRLEAGEEIPGWHLKPGRVNRPIVKIEELFWKLYQHSVTATEFISICTVGKEKAKELLGRATGFKGKELDDAFDTLLTGLTEEKPTAASLERCK